MIILWVLIRKNKKFKFPKIAPNDLKCQLTSSIRVKQIFMWSWDLQFQKFWTIYPERICSTYCNYIFLFLELLLLNFIKSLIFSLYRVLTLYNKYGIPKLRTYTCIICGWKFSKIDFLSFGLWMLSLGYFLICFPTRVFLGHNSLKNSLILLTFSHVIAGWMYFKRHKSFQNVWSNRWRTFKIKTCRFLTYWAETHWSRSGS